MKKVLFVLLLFPFFSGAQERLTESNYRIYSVRLAKEVSLKDVMADMSNYDVLFFGEEHNDSVAHYLEQTLFKMLYEQYTANLTLSMEMFDRDVQPVMNEYLKGFIREKHFVKDARAWPNYRDYKPMVELAKEHGLNVVCANAASRYANLAGRKGQQTLQELPEESKHFFAPLPYDTAKGEYYKKLMDLPRHGAGTTTDTAKTAAAPIGGMGGFNLVVSQSLWDATMAYSIAEYARHNKGKKIMQVNGKFHSDEHFAVVAQLKHYSPKLKTLVVSSNRDEHFPIINWQEYKDLGDYVIVTDGRVPTTYKD